MDIVSWPAIPPEDFLPIFLHASFVLIWGAAYAGLVTFGRMGFYPKVSFLVGYGFWLLQAWSLYELSVLIQADIFIKKVLLVTMIAYLFVPHLYFHLINHSERRYEGDAS